MDVAKQLADSATAIRTAFQALDGIAGQAVADLAAERAAHNATAAAAAATAASTLDPNIFAAFAVDLANMVNDMNEAANRHAVALQAAKV